MHHIQEVCSPLKGGSAHIALMKHRVHNKDLIVLYLNKMLSRIPSFETEDEMREWFQREAARPRDEVYADCRKVLEEAREELENAAYLY